MTTVWQPSFLYFLDYTHFLAQRGTQQCPQETAIKM